VLPASNRLRRSDDYRRAVRAGRRAGRRTVVLHLLRDEQADAGAPARVGFVVSKAVGGAVQRNKVHRRLRALMADHVSELPAGSLVVVRALPAAATASYDELGADVLTGLARVLDAR